VPKFHIWQTTRKALTITAMAAVVTGGALSTTGSAAASTMLADSCAGSVTGNMGDQIAVPGKSLSDVVKTAAKTKEIFLHLNGVDPDALAKAIADKGALTVGQIPQTAGSSIGGSVVASVVTQALQNEGGLGLLGTKNETLDAIRAGVTKSCGITVIAVNYVSPTTARGDGTATGPGGTTAPGGTLVGTGGVAGTGTAPPRDYSNIPAASAGGFAVPPGIKYPANNPLPGQQSPEFGILGAGADTGQPDQSADVRNAGNADALASPVPAGDIQLPMLFAVMALAGVTAALVRTWVLRKVS
jgi:hypothetical protein